MNRSPPLRFEFQFVNVFGTQIIWAKRPKYFHGVILEWGKIKLSWLYIMKSDAISAFYCCEKFFNSISNMVYIYGSLRSFYLRQKKIANIKFKFLKMPFQVKTVVENIYYINEIFLSSIRFLNHIMRVENMLFIAVTNILMY